ncbi:MAG TPA: sialidase family protein [Planctomycetota bacterium]|nr:sialidase family protein [Planctomycetota bacterium]
MSFAAWLFVAATQGTAPPAESRPAVLRPFGEVTVAHPRLPRRAPEWWPDSGGPSALHVFGVRGNDVVATRSFDGGRSFSAPSQIASVKGSGAELRAAVCGSQVVVTVADTFGDGRIVALRSGDSGVTWGAPVVVNPDRPADASFVGHDLVVMTSGRIWTAWIGMNANRRLATHVSGSSDFGATWSAAREIEAPGEACPCPVSLAASVNGELAILHRRVAGGARDPWVTTIDATGQTIASGWGGPPSPLRFVALDGGLGFWVPQTPPMPEGLSKFGATPFVGNLHIDRCPRTLGALVFEATSFARHEESKLHVLDAGAEGRLRGFWADVNGDIGIAARLAVEITAGANLAVAYVRPSGCAAVQLAMAPGQPLRDLPLPEPIASSCAANVSLGTAHDTTWLALDVFGPKGPEAWLVDVFAEDRRLWASAHPKGR